MTKTNENQTDIFSLFGIEDEYAERKKKEEEERLKKQAEISKKIEESKKQDSSANSKKPADEFEVNDQTQVYFYTEVIAITDYFTIEELTQGIQSKNDNGEVEYRKVKENDFKNRLKKDYPMLETGAQVVYIKKKNIVSIILQAQKKGINTSNCSNESDKGSFATSKKVPFLLLKDFICIAKHFSDEFGTEVHADIYFDLDTQSFFMEVPEQQAHPLWVKVTEDPVKTAEKSIEGNFIKCLEIHSHHVMNPTPSWQDDLSERAPLVYAIVGNVDRFFPTITVRTFDMKSGSHIKLSPWKVFENPFTNCSNYDLSVVEVVE